MKAKKKNEFVLSKRQERLLDFIEGFVARFGYPPTLREIIRDTDFSSTSVVSYNINLLVNKGYIRKESRRSRSIQVMPRQPKSTPGMVNVPLLRRILTQPTSHVPLTGMQQSLPLDWLEDAPLNQVYAVRVNSPLMYDAMVNQGDVIVLQRQECAEDGDTVLVVILPEGKTRIRRINYEEDEICLEPILTVMQPMRCKPDEVQVVGKVLGLMRQF